MTKRFSALAAAMSFGVIVVGGQTPASDDLDGSLYAVVLKESLPTVHNLFEGATSGAILVRTDSAWELTAEET